jgi:hypothetical protein
MKTVIRNQQVAGSGPAVGSLSWVRAAWKRTCTLAECPVKSRIFLDRTFTVKIFELRDFDILPYKRINGLANNNNMIKIGSEVLEHFLFN